MLPRPGTWTGYFRPIPPSKKPIALMRIYVAAGQRDRALRQYQTCVDALRRELDVEPSAETAALYEEIAGGRTNGEARGGSAGTTEAIPASVDRDKPAGFWSRKVVRLAAATALVALAAGAVTGGLAMEGVFDGSEGDAAIEYQSLPFHPSIDAIARLVSGDCVTEDIVYHTSGGPGAVSGKLVGTIAVDYSTTFSKESSCRQGYTDGTFTISNAGTPLISAVNFAFIPLTDPANAPPSSQQDFPGNPIMVTGSGSYEGLTGSGICRVPSRTEPISPTEIRVRGEGDCSLTLGPAGQQAAVLMEATTNSLQIVPFDGTLEPKEIALAAVYMNDTGEPLTGLRLRIPQPAGASLAVSHEDEQFVAAHDRDWSLPEIGPGEVARFFINVQLIASSRDEIVVIPEIYGEGLDEPVRSTPLHLRVLQ